jgi:hypothetical protein
VVERVCFARTGSVGSIHPVAPLTFVSQAGSLVTRRVLVADATFKRPKAFHLWLAWLFESMRRLPRGTVGL